MSEGRVPGGTRDEFVPWLLSGTGVALGLALVVETAVFSGLDPDGVSPSALVGAALVAPAIGGLVYGGYWLAESAIDPGRYVRVGWWTLGGASVFFGLNAILQFLSANENLWVTVGVLRGSVTIGGATGLLIGIVEARAIHHAVEAERNELRAGYLEAQRDWLDYLNGLLRHEVLNTAQVVVGYVDVIQEEADLDEETGAQLRAVRRQTRGMTEAIRDVRLLIDATHGAEDLEPVDLASVLRGEVRDLRDSHGSATVDVDLVEDVSVWGDALLPRVFSNLLSNAVEHNDSEHPSVAVSVEYTDGAAVVRVADDGPGVPDNRRGELFDRSSATESGPGVGLHVVSLLVDRYGGDVGLVETGPGGSVFAVELPLAAEASATPNVSGSPVPSASPTTALEQEGAPAADDRAGRASDGGPHSPGAVDPQPDGGADE